MITPSRAPDLLSPGRQGLLAAGRPGEGLEWRIERCLGDVVHIFGDRLHRDIENDAKHRGIAPACALERGDIGVTDKAARSQSGGAPAPQQSPRHRAPGLWQRQCARPHRSRSRSRRWSQSGRPGAPAHRLFDSLLIIAVWLLESPRRIAERTGSRAGKSRAGKPKTSPSPSSGTRRGS